MSLRARRRGPRGRTRPAARARRRRARPAAVPRHARPAPPARRDRPRRPAAAAAGRPALVRRAARRIPPTTTRSMRASTTLCAFLDAIPGALGIPWERIVLGGFSQGGVMSYAVGLGAGRPRPAGIVALSCLSRRSTAGRPTWRRAPRCPRGSPTGAATPDRRRVRPGRPRPAHRRRPRRDVRRERRGAPRGPAVDSRAARLDRAGAERA